MTLLILDSVCAELDVIRLFTCTWPGNSYSIISAWLSKDLVTECDAQQQGWQHEQDEIVVDEGLPVIHRALLVQDERHTRQ